MKTKIQVLAMMFIAAMAFGACDDDDKNDNIKVQISNCISENLIQLQAKRD